jgi:hypothetical protein
LYVGCVLALLVVVPARTLACPNCFASSAGHVLDTYYFSTLMLSLLPFAVVGAITAVGLSFRRGRGARQNPSGPIGEQLMRTPARPKAE